MLIGTTRIQTKYGVYKLKNVPVGSKVPAPEGWKVIINKAKKKCRYIKIKLDTNVGYICSDWYQIFYQDGKKVPVSTLKVGDKIDYFKGKALITGRELYYSKDYYWTLGIASRDNRYYLYNGILTTL